MEIDENADVTLPLSDTINKTDTTLRAVNSIKDELCKLPLNPCEKEYFSNSIEPLLDILDLLSRASVNLATSSSLLTNSPIVFRKKSQLKDTIDLVYDINNECENIYKPLKKRIDRLLDHLD